jgi:hypothetical protein
MEGKQENAADHPLARLIRSSAAGQFPAADGGWDRLPPWRSGLWAVLAFTGHAVIVTDDSVSDTRLAALGVNGFGGAHDPRVIADLAGPHGWIDSLDLLLLGRGRGGPTSLVQRPDLSRHARLEFARSVRSEITVWGYPDAESVVALSRGVAGLPELSFELEPDRRGGGAGTRLVADALTLLPAGTLVLVAVAPGNTASLRAVLRCGFTPVASMQLFRPA